jgi:sugar/nucleoside kinase (ribokinase family)
MQTETFWRSPEAAVAGTGLVALDVVLNERRQEEPKLWTGGTCGNVLAILAYLGWRSFPIARFDNDAPARLIRKDLRRWNLDLRFLSLDQPAPTPIIIHRLRRSARGENFHSFSLNCPECGQRLPMFRPITLSAVSEMSRLPKTQVFFADRVSPGIVALTERFRANGAIIVFEPSAVGDEVAFERMLSLTHILKYSDDRLPDLNITTPAELFLEIQTLGHGGLRFRVKSNTKRRQRWIRVEAFLLKQVSDTAGAGDWCTAGLIHALAAQGLSGLTSASEAKIIRASMFAQALSAWNCGFEGARGGMYASTPSEFHRSIEEILASQAHNIVNLDQDNLSPRKVVAKICSSCRTRNRSSVFTRLLHNA